MNAPRLVINSATRRSLVCPAARRAAALRPTLGFTARRQRFDPDHAVSLLFVRHLQTEVSSSSSHVSGPPPGFKLDEAKKPLPLDAEKQVRRAEVPPMKQAQKELYTAQDAVSAKAVNAEKTVVSSGENPTSEEKTLATKKAEEQKKLTVMQKIKHGVQHFWDGTKLLGTEIKISWKLALKMAAGYELSRRERRQLERTVKDLGRLVPFSVFIIVPAGELFLPFALKLFPNMLPSTYEDQSAKDKKMKQLRTTRKDVSALIKRTLQETGIPVSTSTRQSKEFTEFFRKIRTSGESPSREDLIRVCKIFKDDVTLDNLSRPQLVGMCRYMNLNSFGTDAMLRYNIRHRMRQMKRDDRAISYEGIESLTVPELQNACASRGIRTHGVSPGHLRDDLNTWLELRLKHGIPSTLLILSNAFMYAQGKDAEIDSHYDALQAVLSSIPEELFHEIELEVHDMEGAATNKQRLEVIREQQELIEEENKERDESSKAGAETLAPYYDRDIDEKLVELKEDEPSLIPGAEEAKQAVSDQKAEDAKKA